LTRPAETEEALQYSPTPGLPGLLSQLRALQQREHKHPRPNESWSIAVSTGSQDSLTKAFEMLVEEGDNLLVDLPTYSGALAHLVPLGCNLVGVPSDGFGLQPDELEKTLERLPKAGKGKPKVLYTIPTGQNPAGSSSTPQRKQRIYELACKYDLIIFEDDPYYYLNYGTEAAPVEGKDNEFKR